MEALKLQPKALLLGSLGVIVDTSDLQRRSFNKAFADAGLDWQWDKTQYRDLLAVVGGYNRIAHFAESVGVTVDAAALHRAKSRIFQDALRVGPVQARRGVRTLIERARERGLPVAWVTTTSRANLDATFEGLRGTIKPSDFDLIVDRAMVEAPKPAPDCYRLALDRFGIDATEALSVEDTPESLTAARRAGTFCIAFPGTLPRDSTWAPAQAIVEDLSGVLNAATAVEG
jgi:HAD superfamily hydrolase (TIGR01509 family)